MKYVVQFDDSEMEDLEAILIQQKVHGSGVSVKKIGKNDQSLVTWKADLTKSIVSNGFESLAKNRVLFVKLFESKMRILRTEMGINVLKNTDFSDLKTLNLVFKNYLSFKNTGFINNMFDETIEGLENVSKLFGERSNQYPHNAGATLLYLLRQIGGAFAINDDEAKELAKYVWDSDHPFRYQIVAKPVNESKYPEYYIVFSTAPKYIGD